VTTIYNDPEEFSEDQLAGFLDLYADRLVGVPGGVVSLRSGDPQVAVVIGGGSGHYPAFCGTVGPGLATGAVVGNVFTSPSAAQAYSVAKAADQGRGVIFSFGNYAGDTMNFGIAAQRLRKEGIDARVVVVTDDVASAERVADRRGIAGDFAVFKAMGAAAAAGLDIDEVERVGRAANAATRTIGVAFSGCTMPGAGAPLFQVPAGHMGLGLGIHGEPGIEDVAHMPARELAHLLVDRLLHDAHAGPDPVPQERRRVAPILNGLGTTKYEELFLLWGEVGALLRDRGLEVVEPEVGELVTSLDMGGVSLTLQWLDADLERWWRADAYTPAYRKMAAPLQALDRTAGPAAAAQQGAAEVPPASEASRALARRVAAALEQVRQEIADHEEELGRIDAVAGDGDHGRGMLKGASAAARAVHDLPAEAGVAWTAAQAGQAWAAHAGGTSGVLWGAALEAFGARLGDDAAEYAPQDVVEAVDAFAAAIVELGGAQRGDKTLLDALLPFAERLRAEIEAGRPLAAAWAEAAREAEDAARATAALRPRVGRARPLAEKSVGTPDAGAVSMALVLRRVAEGLEPVGERA
jgi:dihydroxyacetone kinase